MQAKIVLVMDLTEKMVEAELIIGDQAIGLDPAGALTLITGAVLGSEETDYIEPPGEEAPEAPPDIEEAPPATISGEEAIDEDLLERALSVSDANLDG